jgi:hypothetical protein
MKLFSESERLGIIYERIRFKVELLCFGFRGTKALNMVEIGVSFYLKFIIISIKILMIAL